MHKHKRLRKTQELRIQLAEGSHVAWKKAIEAQDFEVFVQLMGSQKQAYDKLYKIKKRNLLRRIKGHIQYLFKGLYR